MALGDPVIVKDKVSPSRFNAKTIHWGTDALLTSITPTSCMVVIPTTTGGSFIKDVPRFRNADNTSWKDLGMSTHTHNGTSAQQGGNYLDILRENFGRYLIIDRLHASPGDWSTKFAGTGSLWAQEDGITAMSRNKLTSGTTTNAMAEIFLGGPGMDFGAVSRLIGLVEFLQDTSVLGRMGIGCEDVNLANSATKKYGFEVCDNAVEGKFHLIFSSDGVARTTTGSTYAILQTTRRGISLLHTPNVNVKMTVNGDDANAVKKPTNVPSSGNIVTDNASVFAVIKAGILSKTTSAREFRIQGVKFVGSENETMFNQSPVDSS